METSNSIKISKSTIMSQYVIVDGPGKFTVPASGQNNEWVNPNMKKAGSTYEKTILVNLRAIEARKVQAVIDVFGDRDEVEINELKNLFIVHQIHLNSGAQSPSLPVKGELVDIAVTEAVDKETGSTLKDKYTGGVVLNITSMIVKAAVKAKGFSFATTKAPSNTITFEDTEVAAIETLAPAEKPF